MKRIILLVIGPLLVLSLSACGGGGSNNNSSSGNSSGSSLDIACTAEPFSVLPVDLSAIKNVTPIGNMGPPTHTLPSDHVGFYLNSGVATLYAPGRVRIDYIGRAKYLVSPFRQGTSDYSIGYSICNSMTGALGHIKTLRQDLDDIINSSAANCDTYSTADETIQSCMVSTKVDLNPGDMIGTVNGPAAFDMGVNDSRVEYHSVNPDRYWYGENHATCPYQLFQTDLRDQLFALIGDGVTVSTEQPVCGTMDVDVAGTASGKWIQKNAPAGYQSDESYYAVLAPYPFNEQTKTGLSFGPASLRSSTYDLISYPNQTSGQVNRPPVAIGPDGLIYCYVHDAAVSTESFFVSLSPETVLTVERLSHAAGASPCSNAPDTWAFSSAALQFIR